MHRHTHLTYTYSPHFSLLLLSYPNYSRQLAFYLLPIYIHLLASGAFSFLPVQIEMEHACSITKAPNLLY